MLEPCSPKTTFQPRRPCKRQYQRQLYPNYINRVEISIGDPGARMRQIGFGDIGAVECFGSV